MTELWNLRPACDFDGADLACLVDRVYREHGDRLAPRRGDRDLLQLEEVYWRSGAFVVLESKHDRVSAGEIIGSAAMYAIAGRDACTLRRFYVDSSYRRRGAGLALMRWAIAWAKLRGYEQMELWSDSRFAQGHHFFQRVGFQRKDEIREMDDGANPYREFLFSGVVSGIAIQLQPDVH